ncbi:MAG: HAMP domain-containing protein, partial [Actinomycetota bacterium]|nr:HAMP domain-containing protein [Actinomycetota bacterium]
MFPFALTLALCSLAAGIIGGLGLRLLPTLRLRLAGLALLASGLPLVAVVASGLIMFDTRHDALVTLIAAAASASALAGALLVSRSISLPLRALRRTAQRLAGGELEARAPLSGPSELREVASVVNEMSTALDGLLRAQRELVAAASHDLRTPLTNLRAAAEALEDGVGDPALHLASLQLQVERMTLLVDDLLDLSRFDAGVVPLDVAEADVEPLLDGCLALYAA